MQEVILRNLPSSLAGPPILFILLASPAFSRVHSTVLNCFCSWGEPLSR